MSADRVLVALTLWRPWTTLVARGIKKIENRPWEPGAALRAGEWFAIHAGKKFDEDCIPLAQRLGVSLDVFEPRAPDSAVVAVARYGGAVTESDDPWFFGPFGWVLREVVEIDPVPCRGAQGLWRVPGDVADKVRAAFKLAKGSRAA